MATDSYYANGDLYDDGLDDRVSFEDGRETIYYSKRSKQGTLEKFLGLDAGTGYSLLLKDAGYSQERQKLKEKQKSVIENKNYQQGSQGPFGFTGATAETTWCNMATQEVTFETSYNLSMALRNENDLYCVNTNANDMQMWKFRILREMVNMP